MRALVTGASGFIGGTLIAELLARGAEVRVLARNSAPRINPARDTSGAISAAVPRFVVDYANPATLRDSPAFEGITHVFHVAGVTRGATAGDYFAGNVTPTEALLTVLRNRAYQKLERFIYVSSQAAAGPAHALDSPTREDDAPRPINQYGRSKLAAEQLVLAHAAALPISIVRPCAVYGPGDHGFLPLFRALARRVALYPGTREHWLSVVHVNDLVQALLRAATVPAATGRTYFVASEKPVQWRELYRMIGPIPARITVNLPRKLLVALGFLGDRYARVSGHVPQLVSDRVRMSEPCYWVCASDRARSELGFSERIELERGIRLTRQWYAEHGWIPRVPHEG